MSNQSFKLVIVGAGTGGVSVAARMVNSGHFKANDIAIIDPAKNHYYQPYWTLVGAGVYDKKVTEKNQKDVIPKGIKWIQEYVRGFKPETNEVNLTSGESIKYEFLVVAAGIQIDWNKIAGLEGNLGKDGICSNYSYDYVDKTWEFLQSTKAGDTLLFTQPPMPIKCAGAPQKIVYLAEDCLRKKGIRDKVNIDFNLAGPGIFGVPKYKTALEKVLQEKNLHPSYEHNLIEVRAAEKIAIFEHNGGKVEKKYDFLHVVPPMSSPDFIKKSSIADEGGWVDVHKHTLQHNKYPNIFSLGDCSSLPTSRTGAAIRKQAPVLAKNLISFSKGQDLTASYDGYASCPLVTSYSSCILAEFGYDGKIMETFPFDQAKPRWSMWFLKAHLLSPMYWYGMLKGRA